MKKINHINVIPAVNTKFQDKRKSTDNNSVKRISFLLLYFLAFSGFLLFSQENSSRSVSGAQTIPSYGETAASLPRNFFGLSLQTPLEEVKKQLKGHPYFYFRGDPDVSFLPLKTQTVIDCTGLFYVNRGLFQFSQGNLYIITLYLNPEKVDYYSMFTTLAKKYGRPTSLDPSGAVWQNETTRISLEKPLIFKYIDQDTFNSLKTEGETQKSIEEYSRQQFLDSF